MKFGTLIRAQRLRQNLSMDKVCGQVDLSKAYLSLIETGQKNPPKDEVVVQIARALGLNEDDLLMRAHRERFPEDVLELRKLIQEMRRSLDKFNESMAPAASGLEPSAEESDLTEDFLAGIGPSSANIESSAIHCTKVLRSTLKELERLMPPETESPGELYAEIEELRVEERDFLLNVIQGVKQLRPRRGPQSGVDD